MVAMTGSSGHWCAGQLTIHSGRWWGHEWHHGEGWSKSGTQESLLGILRNTLAVCLASPFFSLRCPSRFEFPEILILAKNRTLTNGKHEWMGLWFLKYLSNPLEDKDRLGKMLSQELGTCCHQDLALDLRSSHPVLTSRAFFILFLVHVPRFTRISCLILNAWGYTK